MYVEVPKKKPEITRKERRILNPSFVRFKENEKKKHLSSFPARDIRARRLLRKKGEGGKGTDHFLSTLAEEGGSHFLVRFPGIILLESREGREKREGKEATTFS